MPNYRFDRFYYNPDTRELSWEESNEEDEGGQYLRKKVADVLIYFLVHRERVVTKDELLEHVWDHGEYRESSLLQTVRELRRLLGESAQTPRFIRTVHQKGYEWIYPNVIEITPPKIKTLSDGKHPDEAILRTERSIQAEGSPENITIDSSRVPSDVPRKISTDKTTSIGLLILLLTVGWLWFSGDEYTLPHSTSEVEPPQGSSKSVGSNLPSSPKRPIRIALIPFQNLTGDSELQWLELGFTQMLAENLSQQPQLSIIPSYIVQAQLAQTQKDFSPSGLTSLGQTLKADYLLVAKISGPANSPNQPIPSETLAISQPSDSTSTHQNLVFSYELIRTMPSSDATNLEASPTNTNIRPDIAVSETLPFTTTNLNQFTEQLRAQIQLTLLSNKPDISLAHVNLINNQAQEDYAKGLQALQVQGPKLAKLYFDCLLYTSPSPRDKRQSRMPSSA